MNNRFGGIHNSLGFSLLGTIISVGIMGLVVAASVQTVNMMMSSINQLEAKQDLLELKTLFQFNTFSNSLCGDGVQNGGALQDFRLAQASVKSSAAQPGQDFIFELSNGTIIKKGENIGNFDVEDFTLHDATHVSSLPAGAERYLVSARGVFNPIKKQAGVQKFTRNLGTFFIDVSASNQITGCSGNASSNSNSGSDECGCNSTMPWSSTQVTCTGTVPSGTTKTFSCNAGGSGTQVCVSGTWATTAPCPRDGR